MLPNEIVTGHGCIFEVQHRDFEDWTGVRYEAVYTGRVTWSDNDHWELPIWMYKFMEELRASYPDKQIKTQRGDKGWVEIYFRPA